PVKQTALPSGNTVSAHDEWYSYTPAQQSKAQPLQLLRIQSRWYARYCAGTIRIDPPCQTDAWHSGNGTVIYRHQTIPQQYGCFRHQDTAACSFSRCSVQGAGTLSIRRTFPSHAAARRRPHLVSTYSGLNPSSSSFFMTAASGISLFS